MAGSRRDLFKKDGQKLELHNPYMQGAQKPGDMQPLYNQKKGLPDENYHSPSMKGDRIMDTVVTTAGIAMPAGRMEEGIATAIGRIMPAIKKAGPKVMARFGNLLKKAKGNPEALAKIATRFEDDMGGMMLRPSQLQKTDPNYFENINAISNFKSRPIKEPSGKQKIDGWLESKSAYERKAMGKEAPKVKKQEPAFSDDDRDDINLAAKENAEAKYYNKAIRNKSPTFEDELDDIHKIKINPTSKQIITTEDDVQLFKNKDGLVYKREPQIGESENGEPYFMGREERTPIEPRNSYDHDLLEKHFGKDAYKKQMSFLKEKQNPDWPGVTFGF